MSWSDLAESGPGTTAAARPPQRCTCDRMIVPGLAETLGCPYAWHEMPGGWWEHVRPLRRRSASRHRETARAAS